MDQLPGVGGSTGMFTTGPCIAGIGGVFLLLPSIMSSIRQIPLPSAFTSIDWFTNSALPLVTPLATPPALPASSPVLVEKLQPSMAIELPSILTVVEPLA